MTITKEMLLEKAMDSCCGEFHTIVETINECKIGAGARIDDSGKPVYFSSINIKLFNEGEEDCADIDLLEKKFKLLIIYERMGLNLCYDSNGSIYCEAEISGDLIVENTELLIKVARENLVGREQEVAPSE